MIQRRNKPEHELPLTTADAEAASSSDKSRRKKKKRSADSPALIFQAFLAAIVLIGGLLGLSHLIRRRKRHRHLHAGVVGDHHAADHPHKLHAHEPRRIHPAADGEKHLLKAMHEEGELPLAKFHSLSNALAKTDIIALYFAASWCGMSSPITEALDEAFSGKRNTLLYPDEVEEYDPSVADGGGRKPLSIVYVSSDSSEEEMKEYLRGGWLHVPYDSSERSELKKHFRVCAKRELEELGFERKFEIPKIILIDGRTHGIISTNGVEDIKEYGDKALKHWVGMQSLIRGLEDKYEDEAIRNKPEPRIV